LNENIRLFKENKSLLDKKNEIQKKSKLFLEEFEEEKILIEIKEIIKENDTLKNFSREIKSELDYGKQRENKLIYSLYVLQQKGYPVFDTFEADIKNLRTFRFSKQLDEEYKEIYNEENKKKFKETKCLTGLIKSYQDPKWEELADELRQVSNSETSFPIECGSEPKQNKPSHVPDLNFIPIIDADKMEVFMGPPSNDKDDVVHINSRVAISAKTENDDEYTEEGESD
jgi:hypothetical protein